MKNRKLLLTCAGVLFVAPALRAIRARDGRHRWDTQVWGWTWGTPLVTDDTVFYATAGTAKYMITHESSLGALAAYPRK